MALTDGIADGTYCWMKLGCERNQATEFIGVSLIEMGQNVRGADFGGGRARVMLWP